jgi:hypothetical protein
MGFRLINPINPGDVFISNTKLGSNCGNGQLIYEGLGK